MKRPKNGSATFGLFLTTFLIVSTVIVFAVLLFLSYENMVNNAQGEAILLTEQTVNDVASDISNAFGEDFAFTTDEQRQSIIDFYVDSDSFGNRGNIYIIDSDFSIVSTNVKSNLTEIKSGVVHAMIEIYDETKPNTVSNLTSEIYRVISVKKINNTDMYCIIEHSISLSDVRSEYLSIVLLPVIIALSVALALFIGLTQLMIRPLRDMSKTVKKVGEGDYSVRVDNKYTNYDDQNIALTSDLQEMARTVNEMIERIENQEVDRNVFISSVAHDIRTPLTSINGFVTAMLDGTIPYEKQERYLTLIKQEVDRIRRLIVSMTEASSLSKMDPELMEEFNFEEMVLDIRDNLEPQLKEKSITLEYALSEATDHIVYGQSQELCRVVMNIITNAIKFTPENGTIRLTTEPNDAENRLMIYVEDSGPGVEKEKRNRVFESFYKADPSRKQEGFGLGLYICKQILQGHGQTIYLDESKDLGGARFVFSFPYPSKEE